ncbi:MAG: tRNA pseudouridine(38-40) synthase TruA [Firmicutes bacterium]|nr:tRNA pseudouridine(38-40) synthase TruA [Bacillota bacterium]
MRCIKLEIEYNGGKFFGFQKQKTKGSVQESLEKAICAICQEPAVVIGAGRTDAGVHAIGQVCHFRTSSQISCANLLRGLNSFLAPDIVVRNVEEVPVWFHARYSAKGRAYFYFILNRPYPSALLAPYSHWIFQSLNVDLMNRACQYLMGEKDYSGFKAAGSGGKNNMVLVRNAFCSRAHELIPFSDSSSLGSFGSVFSNLSQEIIIFYIEADRFLYRMARNIVGTLIEIGREKKKVDVVEKILSSKNRGTAGPTAPPNGLFLAKVFYSDISEKNRSL